MKLRIFPVDPYTIKIVCTSMDKVSHVPHSFISLASAGKDAAAFHRMKEQGGVETGCADIPIFIERFTVVLCSKTVSSIIYHFQIMFLCNSLNRRYITGIPKNMCGQNSAGFLCNGLFYSFRIYVQGI